jgi:hypothetical protein
MEHGTLTSAHALMTAAPTADDAELQAIIQSSMRAQPVGTRQLWLRELELALDGYGGERNRALTDRIRAAILRVSGSLGAG